jgi:RND family efflux transporter MFP subunit
MNRTLFWIAGGVVLLAVSFVAWKSSRPPRVEAIVIRLENVTSTLAVSGVLEATNRSTVSSQLQSGLITLVKVDIGDLVKAGDILVLLDDSDPKAQLLAADALISQSDSQSNLQDVIAGTASRSVTLAKEALASVNDLKSAAASALINRDAALAKLEQAEVNLEKVRNTSRAEQIKIAKLQLAKILAISEQARREAQRSAALFREGAISKASNEIAETTLATALRDLEIAREQVQIAATPRAEDVLTAESQVVESKAALAGTNKLLALTQKGLKERLTNRQQLVQAQGALDSAAASREVSKTARLTGEAQKAAALSAQSKTVIRSPIDGRISQRLVEPGQTVSSGAPMLVIAGTTELRVHLNVEESSIALVKLGAKATVGIDAFPDLQLPAVVSEIGSAANFQLGTLEVRLAVLKRDARLKPELTADANIFISKYKDIAVVPQGALVVSGQTASVYVVSKGIVTNRPVTWARGNLSTAVIKTGLKPGDIVLTNPRGSKLGSRVEVKTTNLQKGK